MADLDISDWKSQQKEKKLNRDILNQREGLEEEMDRRKNSIVTWFFYME